MMFDELLKPLRRLIGSERFELAFKPYPEGPYLGRATAMSRARSAAFEEAMLLARAARYEEALDLFLLCVAMDGTGSLKFWADGDDYRWDWCEGSEVQAHGVLKAAAKSANVLALKEDDLRSRFIPIANRFLATMRDPRPRFSAEEIWQTAEVPLQEHLDSGTRWRKRTIAKNDT